jgi:hypothetical protein
MGEEGVAHYAEYRQPGASSLATIYPAKSGIIGPIHLGRNLPGLIAIK